MNLTEHIYFNFFTIGALIPSIFVIVLGFFFITIKNKSKASLHFGIAFIISSFFYIAYSVSSAIYHPFAAYHRWITVASILFLLFHFSFVIFSFPDVRCPRFRKIYSSIVYLLSIILVMFFFYESYHSEKVFQFSGHYWDFDADKSTKLVATGMLVLMFSILLMGVWRTFINRGIERLAVLFITVAMLSMFGIPVITNMLSRDGLFDRGTHQLIVNLANITGAFITVIIYLNTTKDRSSFMSKIIIVTVTTLLLMVQGFSYYSLHDHDKSFDLILQSETTLSLKTAMYPEDLEYIVSYSFRDGSVSSKHLKEKSSLTLNLSEANQEFHNTLIYEKIKHADKEKFKEKIETLLSGTNKYFSGYNTAIIEYAKTISPDEKNPSGKILDYIDSIGRSVLYTKNKISQLPDENFVDHLKAFLPNARSKIFNKVILNHIETANPDQKNLKQEILAYLTPVRKSGVRIYRKDAVNKNHYVSVMLADPINNRVIEAGYQYLKYRIFVHDTSKKYIILLLIMVSGIVVGFPFFFWGSLIKPIRNLLSGLQEMQKGNLKVQIPISVADEFGYMSHIFNTMAETINVSTENLEGKVHTRTVELQAAMEKMEVINEQLAKARDALWSEMELAKKIQTVLLQKSPSVSGYEISAYMKPATEVGGDYYDIINVRGIDWLIIGDVSGHGVSAGLVMMMVQSAIQTLIRKEPDIEPASLLYAVNDSMRYNIKQFNENKYMTINALKFLPDNTVVHAGRHEDIMVYRAMTGAVNCIETYGLWIGLGFDSPYYKMNSTLQMDPGDVMLLYTDGITEARVKTVQGILQVADGMYGKKRLIDVFGSCAAMPVEGIKDAIVRSLDEGYITNDDVTLIAVKRK